MSSINEGLDMRGLMSDLRKNRTWKDFRWDDSDKFEVTVFLGVFNATSHSEIIRSNLLSQDWQGCNLVMVDNNSSDSSWEMINHIATELPCPVRVAKNPKNVGGAGSWLSNLDLVTAPWVATMHQDDYYYPEHVQVLRGLVGQAASRVAMCTTSMDRWDGGRGINLFPRTNWLLDASDPVSVFLAHLRFHALPFPTAAFRKSAVESLPISWHDTSFGDTEIVLRLAAEHQFVSHPKATMAYRENPASESHVLKHENRSIGQRIGLLKVFGSDAFGILAKGIALEHRDAFFIHAIESIDIRLAESSETELTKRFLAEMLSIHWNYSSQSVLQFLKPIYASEANTFAISLMEPKNQAGVGQVNLKASEGGLVEFRTPSRPSSARSWIFSQVAKAFMRLVATSGKRRDIDFKWLRRK